MAPTTYRYVSMAPTTYRYNLSKLVESLTDCSDLHTRPNGFYPTYIQNIVIHVDGLLRFPCNVCQQNFSRFYNCTYQHSFDKKYLWVEDYFERIPNRYLQLLQGALSLINSFLSGEGTFLRLQIKLLYAASTYCY